MCSFQIIDCIVFCVCYQGFRHVLAQEHLIVGVTRYFFFTPLVFLSYTLGIILYLPCLFCFGCNAQVNPLHYSAECTTM